MQNQPTYEQLEFPVVVEQPFNYSYPPQQPFPPPYAPYPPTQTPAPDSAAIASMILGICSILLLCACFVLSLPTGVMGLILGIKSNKANKNGMALAGIITSIIGLSLFVIYAICLGIYFYFILSAIPKVEPGPGYELYQFL